MAASLDAKEHDQPPTGGWHSVGAVGEIVLHEHAMVSGSRVLQLQNKPGGVACVGCAWTKPAKPHPVEFCDSGAKATVSDVTNKRAPAEFFAQHP